MRKAISSDAELQVALAEDFGAEFSALAGVEASMTEFTVVEAMACTSEACDHRTHALRPVTESARAYSYYSSKTVTIQVQ